MSFPQATIVISTKNRKEELRRSIASALSQTIPLKVLVIDDGSSDGTTEMVRREFPEVEINQSKSSFGLIVQRNRGAKLAQTPIIISIDDDAVFSTPNVVEKTLREFKDPCVGAVAIPVIDIQRSPNPHHQAPDSRHTYVIYDYVGTAHALRREPFLKLGGYREILVHQGEEEDYCIRMLQYGRITVAGHTDPIHHFESPRRSFERMDYYGARNKVLYAWHNVPLPHIGLHLPATTLLTATFSLKPARFLTRLRGVLSAYRVIFAGASCRQPVARDTYMVSRQLKMRGPLPLQEVEQLLPALRA